MTAIIGGGWYSGSRHAPTCNGQRRGRRNESLKIFSAHAHRCAVALNLNFAETSLVQSLNEHGNEGVEQIAESFGVVCHQLRPRTIALDLIEPLVVDTSRNLVAIHAEDGTISLMFRYALLADYLDEDELSTAMWSVIGTADELDDELQKQFGGKRWVD